MKMTREDAVKEFGKYINYSGHNLFLGYREERNTKILIEELKKLTENRDGYLSFRIVQKFGGFDKIFNKSNNSSILSIKQQDIPDNLLSDCYCSEEQFDKRSFVKKLKEYVKKDLVNRLVSIHRDKPQGKLSKIFNGKRQELTKEELIELYNNHPIINEYVESLNVEIDFLSDEIEVPESTFAVGEYVYFVDEGDVLNNGVVIRKCRVEKCLIGDHKMLDRDGVSTRDRSGVIYVCLDSNDNHFTFFHGHHNDLINVDNENAEIPGNIFINSDEAEEYKRSRVGKYSQSLGLVVAPHP